MEAIRAQPGDYAALVWGRLLQSFSWDQKPFGSDLEFRLDEPMSDAARAAGYAYQGRDPGPIYRPAAVRLLVTYQSFAWVPGLMCLFALSLAAAGLLFGRDSAERGLRSAALLTAGVAIVLIVLPVFTTILAGSILRYRVPAIPVLCLSTAVGVRLLVNRLKDWNAVTYAQRAH
jgi:hypothetical protein